MKDTILIEFAEILLFTEKRITFKTFDKLQENIQQVFIYR